MVKFSCRSPGRAPVVKKHAQTLRLPVLAAEIDTGSGGRRTKVATVDEEPLGGAMHAQNDLSERNIWQGFEGGPYSSIYRIDPRYGVEVDLTFERNDEIRQLMVRRSQIDRPFQRLFQQWSNSPGMTVDRARG